jgi:hypothetical protein
MSPALLSSALASILFFQSASSVALDPRAISDFGDCSNPTIAYVKDADGMRGYGYTPANQKDFPHGATADFTAISDFICRRLQNECRAPASTVGLCDWGALIGLTAKDKQAADAFNENLMRDMTAPAPAPNPAPNPSPAPSPSPAPAPEEKPKYNIETKLSSQQIVYDGDLDLRWWFDNRMVTDDPSNGASCPVDWFPMGDSKAIKFTCSFPDGSVEKLLRMAMNEMIQESVASPTIAGGDKPFARYEVMPDGCMISGGCWKLKKKTSFPIVGDMKLFNLTGDRNEEQGNLHYEISETGSPACKVCSYLAGAGAGTGGLASAVTTKLGSLTMGGAVGVFSGAMTIGCLLGC